MSVRVELRKRARESTVAAIDRAGSLAVATSLKHYGVETVGQLQTDQLIDYIDLIESLPAPPIKAELEVRFTLGDSVALTVPTKGDSDLKFTVTGYEVRYIVRRESDEVTLPYSVPSWKLKRVELSSPDGCSFTSTEAPEPPKVPSSHNWEPSGPYNRYNKY